MAITPIKFIKKYHKLSDGTKKTLSKKAKWFIFKGLVETCAFIKYDISVLVNRYGEWLLDPEFN